MNNHQINMQGMCNECGMTRYETIAYSDCSGGRVPSGMPSFNEWYARHVGCDYCDEGSTYLDAINQAGPHLCDYCLENHIEGDAA